MNEWINTKDRLPEIEQAVLYYAPIFDNKRKCIWTGIYFGDGAFGGRHGFLNDEVTHWQPLPEPPKA